MQCSELFYYLINRFTDNSLLRSNDMCRMWFHRSTMDDRWLFHTSTTRRVSAADTPTPPPHPPKCVGVCDEISRTAVIHCVKHSAQCDIGWSQRVEQPDDTCRRFWCETEAMQNTVQVERSVLAGVVLKAERICTRCSFAQYCFELTACMDSSKSVAAV